MPPKAKERNGASAGETKVKQVEDGEEELYKYDVHMTIPVGHAAASAKKAVASPLAAARHSLTHRGGFPMYAGLGALGIVGALEWPVAVGIGVGYAAMRRSGMLDAPSEEEEHTTDRRKSTKAKA